MQAIEYDSVLLCKLLWREEYLEELKLNRISKKLCIEFELHFFCVGTQKVLQALCTANLLTTFVELVYVKRMMMTSISSSNTDV
jgi:hypothetical protein